MTSNGGFLAYCDLDYALGLFDSVSTFFIDKRTGRNIQHAVPTLLRQSIYSRLAGYEDVNDAERLPGKMTTAVAQQSSGLKKANMI